LNRDGAFTLASRFCGLSPGVLRPGLDPDQRFFRRSAGFSTIAQVDSQERLRPNL
jgi:hypothetical protein